MEPPPEYDLELFERLNEEYRERPFWGPRAGRGAEMLRKRARGTMSQILTALELEDGFRGRTVLELGTGRGWLAFLLATEARAERVIGVDVDPAGEWDSYGDPRVEFRLGDLATEDLVPPRSVDHVVSNAVFEHVTRPIEVLRGVRRVLKPGGTAWLKFNLHASAVASHRYDHVYFPWPHLLFDDSVLHAYFEKHGIDDPMGHTERAGRFAWVNAMSIAHYLEACQEVRLTVRSLDRQVRPIDIDFYLRFEHKLGCYPAVDLETDFATLVIERPRPRPRWVPRLFRRSRPTIDVGYLKRQRQFARELRNSGASRAT